METAKKYLSRAEILSYSVGLLGLQLLVGILNSYHAEFLVGNMGADFAVLGVITLCVKLLSSVFDLVIGNRIDRRQSKMGKLKPFMLYALAPCVVLTILLFLRVPLRGALFYSYLFVVFLLWNVAIALGDVPSQAFSSVLTPNPTERTALLSVANTLKGLGLAASGVLVPALCLLIPGGSNIFSEQDAPISYREYILSAAIISVAGMALFSLMIGYNKERVPYSAEKLSFRDMAFVFRDNRPLKLITFSGLLGSGRMIQTGISVQTSNVVFGSQGLQFLFTFIGIGQLAATLLLPFLCKKLGEKWCYISLCIFGFFSSLLTFFVGTENRVLMFSCMFLLGFQFAGALVMPAILVADSVDYYEYKTGKRIEGSAFAIMTLTTKVTLALSTALGLLMLRVAGYDPGAAAFSDFTRSTVYFAYVAFPGIFNLLSILPMLRYDLYGKKKQEIVEELHRRRGENS